MILWNLDDGEQIDVFKGHQHCIWSVAFSQDGRVLAAGSMDDSLELKTIGHIFLAEAGHYYEVDDGLPQFERGSGGALEADEGG